MQWLFSFKAKVYYYSQAYNRELFSVNIAVGVHSVGCTLLRYIKLILHQDIVMWGGCGAAVSHCITLNYVWSGSNIQLITFGWQYPRETHVPSDYRCVDMLLGD